MKIQKFIIIAAAALSIQAIKAAPTECVLVKGTFSPTLVLATINSKGKLVVVTKVGTKTTDYTDTKGTRYAGDKVGYLSFKTEKSLCSNKDIQDDVIREFALNNKLDTAKASRMSSVTAHLTKLKITKNQRNNE